MSAPANQPVAPNAAGQTFSPERTLRRLFLTLFLRGRSSRGLQREKTPKSIAQKLPLMLALYAVVGGVALIFRGQPVFALSLYLHSMTLVFLGMFVAASSGEVLFNKDEADILMHRPISSRALLWAKIAVLVEVSLWISGAFNLVGFFVGCSAGGRAWSFLVIHAVSVALEALFCTGSVVMIYQLCLRWFGRERLDGLMTTSQVLVAVGAVMMGQLGPRLMSLVGTNVTVLRAWWIFLLPSAWFAGLDDAIAGTGSRGSWLMGAVGMAATTAVLWLAFGKLAGDYETGLQTLNETTAAPRRKGGRKGWISALLKLPPFSWWLRDSVSRASFLLVGAYLFRDRDVKLRLYPGLAPMMIMPFVFLFRGKLHGAAEGAFGVAFVGAFVGIVPLLALEILQYSSQWQAADLFRLAPIIGPGPICHGARRAILFLITLPLILLVVAIVYLLGQGWTFLPLLIPGIIALPLYAMVASLKGRAVPLSVPAEEGKSAGRGMIMIAAMIVAASMAGVAAWAWKNGGFIWLIAVELALVIFFYFWMRGALNDVPWEPLE